MCRVFKYPARFAGLICKIIGLLVLAVLVYAIGGCVGTYEILFSDIDTHSNKTTSMQKAMQVIETAYKMGKIPTVFHTWGTIFAVVYIAIVLVVSIVLCARLAHNIGQDLDEVGQSAELEERQSLRKQYERESSSAL